MKISPGTYWVYKGCSSPACGCVRIRGKSYAKVLAVSLNEFNHNVPRIKFLRLGPWEEGWGQAEGDDDISNFLHYYYPAREANMSEIFLAGIES